MAKDEKQQTSLADRWALDEELAAQGNEVHVKPRWQRDKLPGYTGKEQPTMFQESESTKE